MDATPPPAKPQVLYIVPQQAPVLITTPKPAATPNGSKTVDDFIRELQIKSRGAQSAQQRPAVPAPIFRDAMPRFGDDDVTPVQGPRRTASAGDFAAAGTLFGFGLFTLLLVSALGSMFTGFFMYLGAMLARRMLNAFVGRSSHEPPPRPGVPVKRILPDDILKVAIAAAAADGTTKET